MITDLNCPHCKCDAARVEKNTSNDTRIRCKCGTDVTLHSFSARFMRDAYIRKYHVECKRCGTSDRLEFSISVENDWFCGRCHEHFNAESAPPKKLVSVSIKGGLSTRS